MSIYLVNSIIKRREFESRCRINVKPVHSCKSEEFTGRCHACQDGDDQERVVGAQLDGFDLEPVRRHELDVQLVAELEGGGDAGVELVGGLEFGGFLVNHFLFYFASE